MIKIELTEEEAEVIAITYSKKSAGLKTLS